MSTRVIKQEFLFVPATSTFTPVTLNVYPSFLNTYGVDPGGDNVTLTSNVWAQPGNYWVTGSCDNAGSVQVFSNRGREVLHTLPSWEANIDRTSTRNSTRFSHPGGLMTISINAINTGRERSVGVTISYDTNNTVGPLVWSTRTLGRSAFGKYQFTLPFNATVSAWVWGAGGGGGGNDAGTLGGLGSSGLYNFILDTPVPAGGLVEVFVGGGGAGGSSSATTGAGGAGGLSALNINTFPNISYSGGRGGNSGSSGSSGAGGGGGGASGVNIKPTSQSSWLAAVVAGGGGGGGGAGNDGNSSANYSRRDANITNNAIDTDGPDRRGENGQNKAGDGGGGGGGGGGYTGGQGGSTPGGDSSAFAGQCGGNFPYFGATTGFGTSYYLPGYGGGGARGGGNGQNGRVYMEITPVGEASVKIANQWKQITDSWVKISGSWKKLDKIYIKTKNNWSLVSGAGADLEISAYTVDYGRSTRPYS